MSYILDALRRAEADRERERGAVPGLNALNPPADLGRMPHKVPAPARAPLWLWVLAVCAVAAAAVAVGWALKAGKADAPAQDVSARPAGPVAAEPPVAPGVTRPPPTAGRADGAVTAPPPGGFAPVPPQVLEAASAAAGRRLAAARKPAASAAAAPAPAAVGEPPAAAVAGPPPKLPTLTISGSVYSDDRRSRFIVVNGEVAYEGQTVAPGVVLERIGPREATFRMNGQAVRKPY